MCPLPIVCCRSLLTSEKVGIDELCLWSPFHHTVAQAKIEVQVIVVIDVAKFMKPIPPHSFPNYYAFEVSIEEL